MKKFSLLSLVFVSGMSVFAQDPAMGSTSTPTLRTDMATATRFGIKAGVNLATLNINKPPTGVSYNTTNKTSFNGGFFANIPLGTSGLRFQPELLYSGQGSKIEQKNTVGSTTVTLNYEQDLGYIALPLMFQYQTTNGFFVEAGPQASYLVDARQDGPGSTVTENEQGFDRFDVAGAAGLGYLSRVGFGVNARYNFGLANIFDEGQSKDGFEMKNRVIQIGLVYHFGANK